MRREHNHWSSSFDFANTNDKLILLLNNAHILIQPLRVILALVQMKYPLLNINSNSGPIELRRVDTGPWDRHIGEIGPFKFRPLHDVNVLKNYLQSSDAKVDGERIISLFEKVNSVVGQELGKHYRIGHTYFMKPNLDENTLKELWQFSVMPLLEEYFFDNSQALELLRFESLWGKKAEAA